MSTATRNIAAPTAHWSQSATEEPLVEKDPAPVPFRVRLALEREAVIVAVNGEFDLEGKDDFELHLNEALAFEALPLIVDLERCHFIDSTGIKQLIRSSRLAADRGFSLVATRLQVQRVLDLVGIPEFLSTFETRKDAIGALAV